MQYLLIIPILILIFLLRGRVTKKIEQQKIMTTIPVENEEIFDHLFENKDQQFLLRRSKLKQKHSDSFVGL